MYRCDLPWRAILVDVDGNVKCCCFQKKILGNLNKNSLEEIWNGEQFMTLRSSINSGYYDSFCLQDCPRVPVK